MTRFGLDQSILDKIAAVLREHPAVERAVVYGSRATGHFRPHSDIDLAVYGSEMDANEFAQVSFELRELPIVFTLDVVHFDQLGNAALRERIEREGQALYAWSAP